MSRQYIGDLEFEADFVFATTRAREKIRFSKQERRLLSHFIAHPNVLLSRNQLLDCLQLAGDDVLDRNIDYLLSRLRRKLGDSARAPEYIATQYGEGYIWIAKKRRQPLEAGRAIYLSIGPLYGLEVSAEVDELARGFLGELHGVLGESFGSDRTIEVLPASTDEPTDLQRHAKAEYSLELSFIALANELVCSMVVSNRKTGQLFGSFRQALGESGKKCYSHQQVAGLANAIRNSIWNTQVFRANEQRLVGSDPLTVGLYKATNLFTPEPGDAKDTERELRLALQEDPDNHRAAILLATNLHVQRLTSHFYDKAAIECATQNEKEMGLLILNHLSGIQDDALYLAAAAERLHDLGHCALAESMAERALDLGPSFAACYMVIGRIKAHQGYLREGISYYEHSLEMCETDSVFYVMLQTMRGIAYLALGDQETLREVAPYVLEMETDELKRAGLHLFFYARDADSLDPGVAAALAKLPLDRARYILSLLYVVAAKPFWDAHHRENILAGSIEFFVNVHGPDVIPDEIRESIPSCQLLKDAQLTSG